MSGARPSARAHGRYPRRLSAASARPRGPSRSGAASRPHPADGGVAPRLRPAAPSWAAARVGIARGSRVTRLRPVGSTSRLPARGRSGRARAGRSGRRGRCNRPSRSPARRLRSRRAHGRTRAARRGSRPRQDRTDARRGAVSAVVHRRVAVSTPHAAESPLARARSRISRATRSARRGWSTLGGGIFLHQFAQGCGFAMRGRTAPICGGRCPSVTALIRRFAGAASPGSSTMKG